MMIAETSWLMVCPELEKEVRITELSYVEGGGSCQVDINVGEKSCEEQETCSSRHCPGCLLL